MSAKSSPNCARCPRGDCHPDIGAGETPAIDRLAAFCPMKNLPDVIKKAVAEYNKPEVKEFARQASRQEFEGYEQLPGGLRKPKNPRILELIQFARKCGYKKLGLAFCVGLRNEARTLTEILENNGFEVVSVCCKVGAIAKENIGIKPEEKIAGAEKWESMCNPIAQAEILNSEKVDLAVLLGLCIGHDTLFIRYCQRPVTVIAVKDRVTGHNPLATLYTSSSYYAYLMGKGKKKLKPPF
jgi:uncharacterized metal-binding protein